MDRLIAFIRIILCVISMVFTALFAWHVTQGETSLSLLWSTHAYAQITVGVLWVLVGLSLDGCKYCFWWYRKRHWGYGFVSVWLMGFSWLASLFFFVGGEQQAIISAKEKAEAYHLQQSAVNALIEQRTQVQQLIDKRLQSRFHAQWDRGDQLLKDMDLLNQKIRDEQHELSRIGLPSVARNQSHWKLFQRMARALKVDALKISVAVYAVLALFIEVCALALLGLRAEASSQAGSKLHNLEANKKNPKADESIQPASRQDRSPSQLTDQRGHQHNDKATRRRQLSSDLEERVCPAQITKAMRTYQLPHVDVKKIFEQAKKRGVLRFSKGRYYHVQSDLKI